MPDAPQSTERVVWTNGIARLEPRPQKIEAAKDQLAKARAEERERIAAKLHAKGFVDLADKLRKGKW